MVSVYLKIKKFYFNDIVVLDGAKQKDKKILKGIAIAFNEVDATHSDPRGVPIQLYHPYKA